MFFPPAHRMDVFPDFPRSGGLRAIRLAVLLVGLTISPRPAMAADRAPHEPKHPGSVTVQFPWTHGFQFAGYYAALEKGCYRDAGLEVTLREGDPGTNVIETVIEGRAEYGVSNVDLLFGRLTGRPVVLLAPIFQHSASALLVLESSGIKHIHDLAGKRVMLGSGHHGVEHRMMLKKEGVTQDQLHVLDYSLSLDEMLAGQADACNIYLSDEPYRLKKKGVAFRLFQPGQYGVDFYGDNLFTSASFAARNPGQVAAFCDASLCGWRYAMAHPEEIIDLILRDYAPYLERDKLQFQFETFYDLMRPDIVAVGHSNPDRWRFMADSLRAEGLVQATDAELEDALQGFLFHAESLSDVWARRFRYAAMLGAFMLVSFLLVFLWNASLKRKIMQRTSALSVQTERLKKSEARYAQLSEQSRTFVWEVDMKGLYTYVSPSITKVLGYRPEDLVGKKFFYDVCPAEDRDMLKTKGLRIIQRGLVDLGFENRITDSKGKIHWVLTHVVPLCGENGECIGALGCDDDITERKRMERDISDIGEFERRRIGQDLHDIVGQRFSGVRFMADALAKQAGVLAPAELAAGLQRISEESRKGLRITRQIAQNLAPFDFRLEKLGQALERMADNIQRVMDVDVRVEGSGGRAIGNPECARHLYYIATESVTNAIRHGGARRVTIRLDREADGGQMTVEDDGSGLNGKPEEASGMGLRVMRYRARQIGADLDIGPRTPTGVRIVCRYPANPAGPRPATED